MLNQQTNSIKVSNEYRLATRDPKWFRYLSQPITVHPASKGSAEFSRELIGLTGEHLEEKVRKELGLSRWRLTDSWQAVYLSFVEKMAKQGVIPLFFNKRVSLRGEEVIVPVIADVYIVNRKEAGHVTSFGRTLNFPVYWCEPVGNSPFTANSLYRSVFVNITNFQRYLTNLKKMHEVFKNQSSGLGKADRAAGATEQIVGPDVVRRQFNSDSRRQGLYLLFAAQLTKKLPPKPQHQKHALNHVLAHEAGGHLALRLMSQFKASKLCERDLSLKVNMALDAFEEAFCYLAELSSPFQEVRELGWIGMSEKLFRLYHGDMSHYPFATLVALWALGTEALKDEQFKKIAGDRLHHANRSLDEFAWVWSAICLVGAVDQTTLKIARRAALKLSRLDRATICSLDAWLEQAFKQ